MFISPVNFSKVTLVCLYIMVIFNLNAQGVFKTNQVQLTNRGSIPKATAEVNRSVSNNGAPEFSIKIISDYKTSYGSSKRVGTNSYTFTNIGAKSDNGKNFASDIVVDVGATYTEVGFTDPKASLKNALNGSANLTKLYINDIPFPNNFFEHLDGRFRVKISNIGDVETASILGFKDLDGDGVYDDLEEGGSFKITTITTSECSTNEKGYNAARVLFNNNNGTNLRVHSEKGGYILANKIEDTTNTLTFPSAIDYDVPFNITANLKGVFDPRAYTGCTNQYSELVLVFSEAIDFTNITFSDINKRIISHSIDGTSTTLKIKIPFLDTENQELKNFKINGLKASCFSNSMINVNWNWSYICEDFDSCKVVWINESSSIKTNSCVPFDVAIEKTISDIHPYIGDEVVISTIIKNNSDVIAKDILVKDILPKGYAFISYKTSGSYDSVKGEWKLNSLHAKNENILTIRAEILESQNYTNTASIVAYSGGSDANSNNNISSVVASPIKPSIQLIQQGVFNDENNDSYAQVGETISYAFTVKNTGNTVLKNILVRDPKLHIAGKMIDSLAINTSDTNTFFGSYKITQEDIDLGAFHNKSEVTSYDIKNNQIKNVAQDVNNIASLDSSCLDCSVILLPQIDGISLIKGFSIEDTNVDGAVGNLDDEVTFHFNIINTGNVTLSNILIHDPMLGVTKIDVSPKRLPPAEIAELLLTYTINQEDIDRGYLENSAIVMAESPSGDINNSTDDITDESDAGTDSLGIFIENPNDIESPNADGSLDNDPTNDPTLVKLASKLDLSITKEVDNLRPSIDDEVVFTIKLLNNGNTTVHNIIIDEEIPDGYTYLSHTTTLGTYSYENGEWTITKLNLSEEATLFITVRVLEDGNYLNTASVLSYDGIEDSDETNNDASAVAAPQCLTVYNEFSPNDDGVNDTFEIDCIQNYKNNSLSVFNRWGTTVYQKVNYDNSWGGINTAGKELPIGTYYYVLKLHDGSKDKTGWLFINR